MRAIVISAYPDIEGVQTSYPVAIGTIWEDSVSWLTALTTWIPGVAADSGLRIKGAELQVLIVVPLVALGSRVAGHQNGVRQGHHRIG